jgi:hypothetical protein
MRFAVCLLLLACVSYAAAFFPFLPPYKCVEDKTCVVPRGEPATELNGAGIPQDLPVLRIRQRLPRVSFDTTSIEYRSNRSTRMTCPMTFGLAATWNDW